MTAMASVGCAPALVSAFSPLAASAPSSGAAAFDALAPSSGAAETDSQSLAASHRPHHLGFSVHTLVVCAHLALSQARVALVPHHLCNTTGWSAVAEGHGAAVTVLPLARGGFQVGNRAIGQSGNRFRSQRSQPMMASAVYRSHVRTKTPACQRHLHETDGGPLQKGRRLRPYRLPIGSHRVWFTATEATRDLVLVSDVLSGR